MKKLLVLNASPKKRKSQTERYTAELLKQISDTEYEKDKVYLYELNFSVHLFDQILSADVVVLGTPLYVDCLPAKVLELFSDLESFMAETYYEKMPQVYFVINCGFMEHSQNNTAIEIVKLFCRKMGFEFKQAVSIGSGAVLFDSKNKGLVERAMNIMAKTIEGKAFTSEVIAIERKVPKFLFMYSANKLWINAGKKRGFTKKELKAKYY